MQIKLSVCASMIDLFCVQGLGIHKVHRKTESDVDVQARVFHAHVQHAHCVISWIVEDSLYVSFVFKQTQASYTSCLQLILELSYNVI